ncbi:hypothetical protein V6N11_012888 [Hibiscus sabdariffa]|uniref:RNase H type-1 domain-containing protein n=1 Tax=Hibiscus sabdariffa TaxID=183260 RepID=A0ABR2N9D8_9ROSI
MALGGFEERRRSTLEHARDWLNIVISASSTGNLPLQRIVGTRHLSTEVWLPPSLGWVKVNVDAAQRQMSGYMSIGGVIREAGGQWIKGFGKFVGLCSVFEAELWGAYIGLLCAWNFGYRQVILELDNLDVVSCIRREQQLIGGCLLGPYILELCTLKVSFDVAFDNINLVSVSRVAIRNHEGSLMAVGAFINSNILDPCITEAKACEQDVELAANLNFHNVVVEGDSLSVIKKLQAPVKDRSLICMLIQNIQRRFGDFFSLTFQHCQRNRNKVAHKIAQLGCSFSFSSIWIEEAPLVIEAATEEDRWWTHPQE